MRGDEDKARLRVLQIWRRAIVELPLMKPPVWIYLRPQVYLFVYLKGELGARKQLARERVGYCNFSRSSFFIVLLLLRAHTHTHTQEKGTALTCTCERRSE